jgi:hypothetical protein
MIEQFSLQTLLTYLTLISVPIGVFYHIMMLRNSQKARQTEMLMRLHESKHDKEGLEAFFRVLSMDWEDLGLPGEIWPLFQSGDGGNNGVTG